MVCFKLISVDAREVQGEDFAANWLFKGPRWDVVRLLTQPVLPDRAFEYAPPPSRNFVRSTSCPPISTSRPRDFQCITNRKRRRLSNEETSNQKRLKHSNERQEVATQGLTLSSLPTELIGAIFEQLCIHDAFYLTLVAQKFWQIGWRYIEKKLMDFMAPWAGHRLICMGEELSTLDDLSYVLTADEEQELEQGLDSRDYQEEDDVGWDWHVPVNLCKIVTWRYRDAGVDDVPPYFDNIRMLQRMIQHEMKQPVTLNLPKYFPNDQKWVLRNLTTNEFVRSEVVAGNSKQNGPFFEDIGFEHIVLSRIVLHQPLSVFFTYTWFLSSSKWAGYVRSWVGHCFEIITLDRHRESDETWKDISEEAVESLVQFCRASGCMSDSMLKRLDSRFQGRLSC